MRTIKVKLGGKVEYLGGETWREDRTTGERTHWKKSGDVGKVVEIKSGLTGDESVAVPGPNLPLAKPGGEDGPAAPLDGKRQRS